MPNLSSDLDRAIHTKIDLSEHLIVGFVPIFQLLVKCTTASIKVVSEPAAQ
jgi:hypothetical protein